MFCRSTPLLNEVVARRVGSIPSSARILARSRDAVQNLMILRQFSHHFCAHAPIEFIRRQLRFMAGAKALRHPADSVDVRQLKFGFAFICISLGGCASAPLTPQFAVGDLVVARHFSNYPQLNGTQVRVTGEYKWRWIKGGNTLRCYAVQTVDGQELAAQSFQLQPLPAQRPL